MTYPTNPGYPAPQPSGGYQAPSAPPAPAAPSYPVAPPAPAAPAGPPKMPRYLLAAVAALGFAAYLAGFGPLFSIKSDIGPFGGAQFTASGLTYWTVASLIAALLAAVALLPKAKSYTAVIAVTAVLGLLLVIGQMIHRPTGFSVGWGLWLVLLLVIGQAATAVAALLVESGVLTPPAPRPAYAPYGPPPGGYYPAPGQPGAPQGYPAQYGGYVGGTPNQGPGQSYSAPDTSSPATPPHGFPTYAQSSPTVVTSSDPTVAIPQIPRDVTWESSWESSATVITESNQGSSGSTPGSTPGTTPGSTQP